MLARLFFLIVGAAIAAAGYLLWRPEALAHPIHVQLGLFEPYRAIIAALLGEVGFAVAVAGLLRRSASRRAAAASPHIAIPAARAVLHPTVRRETYAAMMRHGDELSKIGREDAALEFYRHAVTLARAETEHSPAAFAARTQLADALSGQAIAHDELRQHDAAIDLHEQALAIRRSLTHEAPADRAVIRSQCVELQRLADCRAARGQRSRARDLYAESLALEEQLASSHPNDRMLLDDLAVTRRRAAELGVSL